MPNPYESDSDATQCPDRKDLICEEDVDEDREECSQVHEFHFTLSRPLTQHTAVGSSGTSGKSSSHHTFQPSWEPPCVGVQETKGREREDAPEIVPAATSSSDLEFTYDTLKFLLQLNGASIVSMHGKFDIVPLICKEQENQLVMDFGLQVGQISLTDVLTLDNYLASIGERRLAPSCFDRNRIEFIFVQDEVPEAFVEAQNALMFKSSTCTMIPREQVPETWPGASECKAFLLVQSRNPDRHPLPRNCRMQEFVSLKRQLAAQTADVDRARVTEYMEKFTPAQVLAWIETGKRAAEEQTERPTVTPAKKRTRRR